MCYRDIEKLSFHKHDQFVYEVKAQEYTYDVNTDDLKSVCAEVLSRYEHFIKRRRNLKNKNCLF